MVGPWTSSSTGGGQPELAESARNWRFHFLPFLYFRCEMPIFFYPRIDPKKWGNRVPPPPRGSWGTSLSGRGDLVLKKSLLHPCCVCPAARRRGLFRTSTRAATSPCFPRGLRAASSIAPSPGQPPPRGGVVWVARGPLCLTPWTAPPTWTRVSPRGPSSASSSGTSRATCQRTSSPGRPSRPDCCPGQPMTPIGPNHHCLRASVPLTLNTGANPDWLFRRTDWFLAQTPPP